MKTYRVIWSTDNSATHKDVPTHNEADQLYERVRVKARANWAKIELDGKTIRTTIPNSMGIPA